MSRITLAQVSNSQEVYNKKEAFFSGKEKLTLLPLKPGESLVMLDACKELDCTPLETAMLCERYSMISNDRFGVVRLLLNPGVKHAN